MRRNSHWGHWIGRILGWSAVAYFVVFVISLRTVGPGKGLTAVLEAPLVALEPVVVLLRDHIWPYIWGALLTVFLLGLVAALLRLIGLALIPPRRR